MTPADWRTLLDDAAKAATGRIDLWTRILAGLKPATVTEIGVQKGEYASAILKQTPSITAYYLVDPWRHLGEWNKPANKAGPVHQEFKRDALAATEFAADRRIVLEGTTTEVAGRIPDGSNDFVYIDGDHTLRGISIDLISAWPKLKAGGLLAGDDLSPTIWQHAAQFEPTFVFPMAVHFAEAMGCPVYALPFNQFAVPVLPGSGFVFHDLAGRYPSTAVRNLITRQAEEQRKFEALYGDFRAETDYNNLEISGLKKESGKIRGEIVNAVAGLDRSRIKRVLLPGENNTVKPTYARMLGIPEDVIVTAGLSESVDVRWDFEQACPDFGQFDLILTQAMLEHLLDPYKHVRDLCESLAPQGQLVLHTVLPGFPYHRHPIDCVRFFPDWFEAVADRLNLEIEEKYIGQLRIMYRYRNRA